MTSECQKGWLLKMLIDFDAEIVHNRYGFEANNNLYK